MSASAITASKIFNMGGEPLNTSAVKNITWNILNENPHKAYLKRHNETTLVRQQLLQLLAVCTGIRQQANTLTTLATNSACASITLTNPMKAHEVKAFHHINEMIRELNFISNINAEYHAHTIILKVIEILERLPNEGNQTEIEAAKRLIDTYCHPIPTRPSTPENVEMEPLYIPAPKKAKSAWHTAITDLVKNARYEPSSSSNKENIPPAPNHSSFPNITNWHDPSLNDEIRHLRDYLEGVSPVPSPTEFKLEDNYLFAHHNEDKSPRSSYWSLILTKFFMNGTKTDCYGGKAFKYVEARLDNAKHFIGFQNNKCIIAKDKRSLFKAIDGVMF